MVEEHGSGDEGALAELTAALDALYRQAGRPSLRSVSRQARDDDDLDLLSHQTVADILRGKAVPSWAKLRSLVVVLGRASVTRPDPESLEHQFHRLWDTASSAAKPGPDAKPAPGDGLKRASTCRANEDEAVSAPALWRLGESLTGGLPPVRCVSVAADGSAMAVVVGDRLQITDPQTRKPLSEPVKNKKLRHVALSPDGSLLAAFTPKDPSCELSVRETRTRRGPTHNRGHLNLWAHVRGAVQGLVFTAQGRLLYLIHDWPGGEFVDRQPLLRLMDPLTKECVGPPVTGPLDRSTRSVALCHDGTRAATVDRAGVHLWDAPTGELLDTLALESIDHLAFAPGGHLLCLGSDGTLHHTLAPTKI